MNTPNLDNRCTDESQHESRRRLAALAPIDMALQLTELEHLSVLCNLDEWGQEQMEWVLDVG
jgi:hypothetical protein